MTNPPEKPMNADELHALVDQPLVDVAALDKLDASSREAVAAWRLQRSALQRLHLEVSDDPLPVSLLQAAQRLDALQHQHSQSWRWAGMAASVLLSFGLGWLTHETLGDSSATPARLTLATQQHEFVRQAGYAHAVYLPEKRHPVEVAASEQEHLVQWLSKRLGKPIKVPHLEAQGFELVGGRLLPGEQGPRAQFMFQRTDGTRVTLYLGGMTQAPGGADVRETRFEFAADGPTPSFYWFDQGFGYALSGQLSRESLLDLAGLVYRQLRGEAGAHSALKQP